MFIEQAVWGVSNPGGPACAVASKVGEHRNDLILHQSFGSQGVWGMVSALYISVLCAHYVARIAHVQYSLGSVLERHYVLLRVSLNFDS